ncbi:RNaseH domain-containing protein [Kitasatospora purpeofusca]|uniref:RNaseH domain-containing protein n=1 Tax=Kitasatospora purpeofusca TaxID=67352 RepID=UPI0037F6B3EC
MRVQRGDKWKDRTEQQPRLMWTLVAFVPRGNFWEAWVYIPPAHNERSGWYPYATAQTIHRGAPLPDGSRQDDALPRRIDHALSLLGQQDYVVYISGRGTRSLWPLLANKNLDLTPDSLGLIKGRPALPGISLPDGRRPRAIIRTTAAGPDLLLPAFFEEVAAGGTVTDGDKTSNSLFRLQDTDRTFILSNRPHQMDGKTYFAKAGRDRSRWAPQNGEEQAETWYSLNATEITVLHCPDHHDPATYAITTTRLCNYPLAGEHRTQLPLPIHAAVQMDKDHPDYRRSIDWETEEGDD